MVSEIALGHSERNFSLLRGSQSNQVTDILAKSEIAKLKWFYKVKLTLSSYTQLTVIPRRDSAKSGAQSCFLFAREFPGHNYLSRGR